MFGLFNQRKLSLQFKVDENPSDDNERQRDRSHSVDSSRQVSLSTSCTGSGGGGGLKKKNVVFSERAGSIPEDGENVLGNETSEIIITKNGRCDSATVQQ